MKKTKKLFIYLLSGIILLLLTSPFLAVPLMNNVVVWQMESKLKNIPLPEETNHIQSKGIVGKLNGNGNGVNYLATLVIESKQSIEELKSYYQLQDSEIEVIKQEDDTFENDLLEHGELTYQKLEAVTNFSNYYTVFVYDSAQLGSILTFDFRGH